MLELKIKKKSSLKIIFPLKSFFKLFPIIILLFLRDSLSK